MRLTSVIVDDEYKNRSVLEMLIESNCRYIDVIDSVESVRDAVESIQRKAPDIVFLDVEMPESNGFSLFNYFPKPSFKVVFVTAFEHYAIKAIQNRAFDYLLKPVEINDLIAVENRLLEELRDRLLRESEQLNYIQRIEEMFRDMENRDSLTKEKVYLPVHGGFRLICLPDILYLEASGAYTLVRMHDKTSILVTRSIGEFEKELDGLPFVRCHKSFVVNLNFVDSYSQNDQGLCKLTSGDSVPVSRRKHLEFVRATRSYVNRK